VEQLTAHARRIVHAQPLAVVEQRDLEVVEGMDHGLEVDRGAAPRPGVLEVDLLADVPGQRQLGDIAWRMRLRDVDELLPWECLLATANFVVHVLEPQERIPGPIHAGAWRDLAGDEPAVAIGLTIADQEHPQPGQEALRKDRVSRLAVDVPKAHLRHEAGVGSKVVAEITIVRDRVVVPRAVEPHEVARRRAQ